jgi:hypothetical protein
LEAKNNLNKNNKIARALVRYEQDVAQKRVKSSHSSASASYKFQVIEPAGHPQLQIQRDTISSNRYRQAEVQPDNVARSYLSLRQSYRGSGPAARQRSPEGAANDFMMQILAGLRGNGTHDNPLHRNARLQPAV